MAGKLKIKRVYEPYEKSDGFRILIDRLWPRGIKKEDAHIDVWLKEIAPSNELRKAFHSDKLKWESFRTKYLKELEQHSSIVQELQEYLKNNETTTLLYGAKDSEHNQAVVLKNYLQGK